MCGMEPAELRFKRGACGWEVGDLGHWLVKERNARHMFQSCLMVNNQFMFASNYQTTSFHQSQRFLLRIVSGYGGTSDGGLMPPQCRENDARGEGAVDLIFPALVHGKSMGTYMCLQFYAVNSEHDIFAILYIYI